MTGLPATVSSIPTGRHTRRHTRRHTGRHASGDPCGRPRFRDDERGTAVTEAAIAAPLLLLLVMAVVFVGRVATADGQLEGAARDAARAASLERTRTAAVRSARTAAAGTLTGSRPGCRSTTVTVDLSGWRAGGQVAVQIRCLVPLGSLGLLGVPGSMTRTAAATAPIDRFRGIGLGFVNSEGSAGGEPDGGAADDPVMDR